jgi:hypothetical protein
VNPGDQLRHLLVGRGAACGFLAVAPPPVQVPAIKMQDPAQPADTELTVVLHQPRTRGEIDTAAAQQGDQVDQELQPASLHLVLPCQACDLPAQRLQLVLIGPVRGWTRGPLNRRHERGP